MSLQINPMPSKVLSFPCQTRPSQRFIKTSISCQLSMHKGGQKSNFYEVLSLGNSDSVGFEDIKKAYRRMALQYHPDVCPSYMKDESTKRFVELQKVYETLSNPVSRRIYDYELGLIDNYSLGFVSMEERTANFPTEVWERQLYGLKQRSAIRMKRKKI
ncbi:hypothetical protein Q3G72_009916 [Acer saccharum]|nr:hypothetical protein Q3G72_009916 [Acer saccharum]